MYSKRAYAEPLKDKTAKETAKAIKNIFDKVGQRIRNLHTDDGKEFFNGTMKQLLNQYGINHYSTYSVKKASIVERLIRTIKRKLYTQFTLRRSQKWYDILQQTMNIYNNTR